VQQEPSDARPADRTRYRAASGRILEDAAHRGRAQADPQEAQDETGAARAQERGPVQDTLREAHAIRRGMDRGAGEESGAHRATDRRARRTGRLGTAARKRARAHRLKLSLGGDAGVSVSVGRRIAPAAADEAGTVRASRTKK